MSGWRRALALAAARLLALAGIGALAATAAAAATPALRHELLDDFRDAAAWKASASDQVKAGARRDADGSLCLDYDFAGVSGYAVLARRLPVDWPERFDLVLRYRGSGALNDFQFKLVDASGDNVWWMNRPNHPLPAATSELKIRKRHIVFAWGPTRDKRLTRTETIEFVIAAGRDGGKGSLCLSRLELRERARDPVPWPAPREQRSNDALTLDLGAAREFNGLALRWPAAAGPALDYEVLARDSDRGRWQTLRRVRGSDGGLDALFLPESEARQLRVQRVQRRQGRGLPTVELRSAAEWPTLNAVLAEQARALRRGEMPRAFVGEQNYWALVGVDGGGARSGLVSEDGAVELGRGGASVEPVVRVGTDSKPVTWADVAIEHTLPDGFLPLPRVRWRHAAFTLDIDVAADGSAVAPALLARYTLHNTSTRREIYGLQLALRPWQVNPPQQFLATPGGERPLRRLAWRDGALVADGRALLLPTTPPRQVRALAYDGGLGLAALAAAPLLGTLGTLHDPQAHASALLEFEIELEPGQSHSVGWVAPLGDDARAASADAGAAAALAAPAPAPITAAVLAAPITTATLDARIAAAATAWRARLSHLHIDGPPELQRIAATLRTSLAHILMSRDGPALRPGTRSYARTWIRDGAMMSAALVRLGEVGVAREFVDGYAGHLFASGKVPCCVDARGADPVVENDSAGEYLYAVAEVMRGGGADAAFLARHWPHVQRVVAWMEALRQSERTAANRAPGRERYFGLMPPSISHEGYSDKPAYSYWDDFWALRGYKDAAAIARAVGDDGLAARWAGWRDEFERELAASIEATGRHFGIDTIAGAADRGDFDPTSTTIALDPAQAAVSRTRLAATFESYCELSRQRARGQRAWADYTPYELRTVGALVRLGRSDCAHEMLDFFFRDQRPAGWNQWAEVVLPEPRAVKFLGDMPHAWVSSDYIRSALDLLAYEREAEGTLVLGAGLEPAWLAASDIGVAGLVTSFGPLAWRLVRLAAGGWTLQLDRAGAPARLRWPGLAALPTATHEGKPLAWQGRELPLPPAPSRVRLAAP